MNILPSSDHHNLHLTSTLPANAALILPLYSILFEVVFCLFCWLVNLPISCDARLSPASPSQPPWQALSSTDSLTRKPLVNFLTMPHTASHPLSFPWPESLFQNANLVMSILLLKTLQQYIFPSLGFLGIFWLFSFFLGCTFIFPYTMTYPWAVIFSHDSRKTRLCKSSLKAETHVQKSYVN